MSVLDGWWSVSSKSWLVAVTIGITVGLFGSNLAVTTFISAAHRIQGRPPRKSQVGSAF